MRQGFIHGSETITHADDSFAIPKCLIKGLAQCERHILDSVMSVNFKIAFRLHKQIEQPMHSEMGKHVVEETDSCGDFVFSTSIEVEVDFDFRFVCFA